LSVRRNVVANFAGHGWSAALQLVLVPLYIHFLGIEAYGLVSFYAVLMATMQIFDLGLAQTLNRELARALGGGELAAKETRELVRTLEVVYWIVVLSVCVALALAVPLLATYVVSPMSLSPETVQDALTMMLAVVVLQWPVVLYQGGLMGLQKQVLASALRMLFATITAVGSVVVLSLVSATLQAFFVWQILVAGITVTGTALAFHRHLPSAPRAAQFRPRVLARLWRFAAGACALTAVGVLLTQGDKWILLERLSLEAFGYFALAASASGALGLFTTPIFAAVFPRFSSLVARREHGAMLALYHMATQATAVGIGPLALILSLYAEDVLWAWTGKAETAYFSGPLLSVLALGSLLNCVAHPPYASELARGRTSILLGVNAISAAVALPAVWLLAPLLGGMAAALMWFAISAVNFTIAVPLVHSDLPAKSRVRWLLADVSAPLAAAAIMLVTLRPAMPQDSSRGGTILALAVALLLALAAALIATPALRAALVRSR